MIASHSYRPSSDFYLPNLLMPIKESNICKLASGKLQGLQCLRRAFFIRIIGERAGRSSRVGLVGPAPSLIHSLTNKWFKTAVYSGIK